MKSYTDLEQSKALAKILPIESADMRYQAHYNSKGDLDYVPKFTSAIIPLKVDISCWSLSALLGVLPEYNLQRTDWGNKTEYKIVVTVKDDNYASKNYDNPVDACVDMIFKLKELKML